MGLLEGTMNGCFYMATAPDIFRNAQDVEAALFARGHHIERHGFTPINKERGELSAKGLVEINDLLRPARQASVLFGDMVSPVIAFGVRIDTLKLDLKIFRAKLKAAIADAQEDRAHLSKEERLIIEDKVRMEMINAAVPATKVIDVAWDTTTGMIWIGAANDRAADMIEELMHEAFGIEMRRVTAVSEAARFLGHAGEYLLAECLPSDFTTNFIDTEDDANEG